MELDSLVHDLCLPLYFCNDSFAFIGQITIKTGSEMPFLQKSFQSKEEGKAQNRYNQVPHMAHYTVWASDKTQEISHTRDKRGQSFPNR